MMTQNKNKTSDRESWIRGMKLIGIVLMIISYDYFNQVPLTTLDGIIAFISMMLAVIFYVILPVEFKHGTK